MDKALRDYCIKYLDEKLYGTDPSIAIYEDPTMFVTRIAVTYQFQERTYGTTTTLSHTDLVTNVGIVKYSIERMTRELNEMCRKNFK